MARLLAPLVSKASSQSSLEQIADDIATSIRSCTTRRARLRAVTRSSMEMGCNGQPCRKRLRSLNRWSYVIPSADDPSRLYPGDHPLGGAPQVLVRVRFRSRRVVAHGA